MPIKATTRQVAAAINRMTFALEREYKTDFAYSISHQGMIIAQTGMYGLEQPRPMIDPDMKSGKKRKVKNEK